MLKTSSEKFPVATLSGGVMIPAAIACESAQAGLVACTIDCSERPERAKPVSQDSRKLSLTSRKAIDELVAREKVATCLAGLETSAA